MEASGELKAQVENVLLKRGFQVEIAREEQLLDDKRTDFLIRYGFVGPIVIEIKLTSNTDIRGKKIGTSESFRSMDRYMRGYGATHGIFLVVDNIGTRNLSEVRKTFSSIRGVSVLSFDCSPEKDARPTRRRKTSTPRAKSAARRRRKAS